MGTEIDANNAPFVSWIVIDAYAKSGEKDAAQHAEAVFQRMLDAYKQGNHVARPNDRSFNAGECWDPSTVESSMRWISYIRLVSNLPSQ